MPRFLIQLQCYSPFITNTTKKIERGGINQNVICKNLDQQKNVTKIESKFM